jgi:molybdopterin-guanine dinucleotide biosynthesis protein A
MMSDASDSVDTGDTVHNQGPLAGLVALLGRAGAGSAIAVACDMPFVTERLVRRLVDAPWAHAVAARREGRWEPFFARYDAAAALPIASARLRRAELSLAGVLDELGAHPLVLLPHEASELDDWDTPSDVRVRRRT